MTVTLLFDPLVPVELLVLLLQAVIATASTTVKPKPQIDFAFIEASPMNHLATAWRRRRGRPGGPHN
jgi:hypothetical protein